MAEFSEGVLPVKESFGAVQHGDVDTLPVSGHQQVNVVLLNA